jgi:hypothetical protein
MFRLLRWPGRGRHTTTRVAAPSPDSELDRQIEMSFQVVCV